MKNVYRLFLAVALSSAALAVPQRINYQGFLTDSAGIPLDTTVAVAFQLFDAPTEGAVVWNEVHPNITVNNGLFSAQLGTYMPLLDVFASDVWLGISIGNNAEMTPRRQIISVPHAYRVGTVDGAYGGTILNKLNVGEGNTNAGDFAMVAGQWNSSDGDHAVVGGGSNNRALGVYSVVAGGGGSTAADSNLALADWSTVGGGRAQAASGRFSTVSGGESNIADGWWSTIPGGYGNLALGQYSFAAGRQATTFYDGTLVWGSSSTGALTYASDDHTVTFRCENGAHFYTHPSATNIGVVLPAGTGAWSSLSDSTDSMFASSSMLRS